MTLCKELHYYVLFGPFRPTRMALKVAPKPLTPELGTLEGTGTGMSAPGREMERLWNNEMRIGCKIVVGGFSKAEETGR